MQLYSIYIIRKKLFNTWKTITQIGKKERILFVQLYLYYFFVKFLVTVQMSWHVMNGRQGTHCFLGVQLFTWKSMRSIDLIWQYFCLTQKCPFKKQIFARLRLASLILHDYDSRTSWKSSLESALPLILSRFELFDVRYVYSQFI